MNPDTDTDTDSVPDPDSVIKSVKDEYGDEHEIDCTITDNDTFRLHDVHADITLELSKFLSVRGYTLYVEQDVEHQSKHADLVASRDGYPFNDE